MGIYSTIGGNYLLPVVEAAENKVQPADSENGNEVSAISVKAAFYL